MKERVYDFSEMSDANLEVEDKIRISNVHVDGELDRDYNGDYKVVDSSADTNGSQTIKLEDEAQTTFITICLHETYDKSSFDVWGCDQVRYRR